MIAQIRGDGQFAPVQSRVADSRQAGIGFDFESREVAAGRQTITRAAVFSRGFGGRGKRNQIARKCITRGESKGAILAAEVVMK